MPAEGDRRDDTPSLIFRLNDDGEGPELLKEAFYERGWTEFDEEVHDEHEWNMWWKTSRFRTSDYNQLYPWQRVNHCPKATGITRKDCLARLLKLQHALHGAAYSFAPQSFILPNDYRRFTQQFSAHAEKRKTTGNMQCWICKPADMSRGRGIIIIRELGELQYDTNSIVQQYITKPFLIHGHKFDMRLYVVVVSYHPLRIYLYDDGLVRFSCEKYDLSSLGNVYAHLTNTSINRFSTAYNVDKVGIGHGSKWTIKQLRHYFHQNHIDDAELWWRVISIINLTIIPQVSEVPKTTNCFELYGFDILIDKDLKPWLLEVNFSPSLTNDCAADGIKKSMLMDLIELMEYKTQDNLHGRDPYQGKVVACNSTSRLSLQRGYSHRPQTMMMRLPKIISASMPSGLHTGRLYTSSAAFNSSEPCGSEVDEEDEFSPREDSMQSILTCTLSRLNIPSLVDTTSVSPVKRQRSLMRERLTDTPSVQNLRRQSQNSSEHTKLRYRNRTPQRPTTQSVSSVRPKCYNKPWRQDSGPLRIKRIDSAEKRSKEDQKNAVGGFHRVYPFNTLTGARELSPRQMVTETHQMIKSKCSQSSVNHNAAHSQSMRANHKPQSTVTITSPFPDLKLSSFY